MNSPRTDNSSAGARSLSKADAAIELVIRAARLNETDPCRYGAVVELESDGDCFITGDLHGYVANFRRIVSLANLPRHTDRHLVMQELVHETHKPVADLCLSYRLVEMAARLKVTFPDRFHTIMGNHELAELLDFGIAKNRRPLNDAFDAGLVRAYGAAADRVKAAYKEYWRSLPLAVRFKNGVFLSHSIPSARHMGDIDLNSLYALQPGEALTRRSPIYHMLWDRDYSEETCRTFALRMKAKILILAHTPCRLGYEMPNPYTLLLDCKDRRGCYAILPIRKKLSATRLKASVQAIHPDPA